MIAPESRRPERIDQIIPAIVEYDAVSNHTFEAQRLLRAMGFTSEIYAEIIGPGTEGRVHPVRELPRIEDGSQWVLYQCSIGSPVADVFAAHPGTKLLDYHNITPAELVERWLPPLGAEARLGRRQLLELAPLVHCAFADSPYNAEELVAAGYARASVVPVLVDAGNIEAEPDPRVLAALGAARARGGTDWLFVGQVAPHKAQHDLVKAFACYRRAYDPLARLHLVGREMGRAYRDAVSRFASALGLGESVELPGSVPTGALAAYFASADVFVCLSDHEGFCAPIIESMARGLPVVAYAAAAVSGTVAGAGVTLATKEPALVAAAVHEVLTDPGARDALASLGRARAGEFSLQRGRQVFRDAIEQATAIPTARGG